MKKMMMVQALVPSDQTHALDRVLEQIGAREIMFRPYHEGTEAPKANGHAKSQHHGGNNMEHGELQRAWLADYFKKKGGEIHVPDMKKDWVEAGYSETSLYGALQRSAERKLLKKVKPGIYRLVSNG